MRFSELCRKVLAVYDRYAADNGIKVNDDYAVLKLVEEVGEFAQAVIIKKGMCRTEKRLAPAAARRNVGAELSDILGLTILCADRMGVDLEAAIAEKWLHFLDAPAKLRGRARTVVSKKRRPRAKRGR